VSFGDLYTVQPGQGNPPDLPQIDLPKVEPGRRAPRTSITVSQPAADPWAGSGVTLKSADEHVKTAAQPSGDSWEGSGVKFKSADEHVEAATEPQRQVGAGEAFSRESVHSATMGLYPAISGAVSAGQSPQERAVPDEEFASHAARDPIGAISSRIGSLVKGLKNLGLSDEEAHKVYEKGRDEAQKALEAGREQHPWASLAGGVAGAVAVPVPGLAAAAAPARILRGAGYGAAGGAAYGAGSALSEGKDAAGIGKGAAVGGTLGAATGGLFGGLLGPRATRGPATQGERAAETARKYVNCRLLGLASAMLSRQRKRPLGIASTIWRLPLQAELLTARA
jgi:hypothetical protein